MVDKIPTPPTDSPDERAHRRQIAQATAWLLEKYVEPSGAEDAYPVGSVYIATVSTDPSTLLGFGTWARIAEGRCLIGEGTGSGLTARTAGATGGREDSHLPEHSHSMTHTHTGNTSNTGNHTHDTRHGDGSNDSNGGGGATGKWNGDSHDTDSRGAHSHTLTIDSFSGSTGNTGTSNIDQNMIPYLVVYIWERTA